MIKKFEIEYVETLPLRDNMKENIIYLSEKTWNSSHLCACGCGEEVITPFVRGGWRYQVNSSDEITLSPAITNDICNSTYKIQQNYAIL